MGQNIEDLRYASLYIMFRLFKMSGMRRIDLHHLFLDEAQQVVELVIQKIRVKRIHIFEYAIYRLDS